MIEEEMNSSILADESVSGLIIKVLRNSGIELQAVIEISPGINDLAVINLAKDNQALMITEDKDFGEWVFSHKIEGFSVLFLRYDQVDVIRIAHSIRQILTDKETFPLDKQHYFITLTNSKVRIRPL